MTAAAPDFFLPWKPEEKENNKINSARRKKTTKKEPYIRYGPLVCCDSLSALNFAGSQASGAYMHFLVCAVYFNSNSLHIRIPDSVGSSMRMADVVAEMSALATDITFSHLNTS